MRNQLATLCQKFLHIEGVSQLGLGELAIEFECGPHSSPLPLKNERAVYAFFQKNTWLRIGQTGYSQRFTSQHYGTKRAGSAFAKDLWQRRNEFGYDGIEAEIGQWIKQEFGRANVRLPAHHGEALSKLLEAFLHLNLSPRFEGRKRD